MKWKEEERESTQVGEMNKHAGETLFSHTHINECYNLHTCTRRTSHHLPSYLKFKKVLAVRHGLGLVREGGGGPGGGPAAISSNVQVR